MHYTIYRRTITPFHYKSIDQLVNYIKGAFCINIKKNKWYLYFIFKYLKERMGKYTIQNYLGISHWSLRIGSYVHGKSTDQISVSLLTTIRPVHICIIIIVQQLQVLAARELSKTG